MPRRHSSHASCAHASCAHAFRARPDPITGAGDALSLISLAMHHPLQHEVIGFLLDSAGVGGAILVVTDARAPDCVVDVVDTLSLAAEADARLSRLVVASIRPWAATVPGDIDRWLEASAIADARGIELVEWFVIGPAGAECPRDLLGEPERW